MATGYDRMEQAVRAIRNDDTLSERDKAKILATLLKYRDKKANILITGATGSGKSSTINAMFNMEVAEVGVGVDPETMDVDSFDLGSLILWDSPGLGDSKKDAQHARGIIKKLHEKDNNGDLLIDAVLVVLDGRSRDLGTSYELINNVIIPNLKEHKRLLVGINQADMMMDGRHWNHEQSKPLPVLEKRIEEKEDSVYRRIYDATGVKVEPVTYSAGYKEEGHPQEKPYNLSKLLCHLIEKIPEEKRLSVLAESSDNNENWISDDGKMDYNKKTMENAGVRFLKDAAVGAASGAALGAAIGSVIPVVGTAIGAAVGTVGGAVIAGAGRVLDKLCFITTATCNYLGKNDDCYELNAFRRFRDNWLVRQPDGERLVQDYYSIAPQIVTAIEGSITREKAYQSIWERYLTPCLAHIENGEYEECKATYENMVHTLTSRYVPRRQLNDY